MPAIASLEDLKATQEDLLEVKDLDELKTVFKNGAALDGKTSGSFGFRNERQNN